MAKAETNLIEAKKNLDQNQKMLFKAIKAVEQSKEILEKYKNILVYQLHQGGLLKVRLAGRYVRRCSHSYIGSE
jgi:hypothetical protein